MERYRILYCHKIINGFTQNCGVNWKSDDINGILMDTIKCKQYSNSLHMQSFHYMGPRLYNSLPKYLRKSNGDYQDWKQKLDVFLAKIPDCPITRDNESGLCDQFTARPTNSLIKWIPHLGLSGRRDMKPDHP